MKKAIEAATHAKDAPPPKKAPPKRAKAKKKARAKKSVSKAVTATPSTSKRRALVVVESPTKAKTIKKYLGAGFFVKASVGHVKDLPKSSLAVDIEHDFLPVYETIRGKAKVLKEIKDAAKDADVIYLAPDPDREGEAIAWHIAQELGKKHQGRVHRITFNEITQSAVKAAIEAPQALNLNRFNAQQARRVLDRIVGYQISPILWDKVRRGLSAGRVQSVAVRLVVEREKEVQAFVAEEYWSVKAQLKAQQPPIFFAQVSYDGEEKFRPIDEKSAMQAVDVLKKATVTVDKITRRERRRKPQPPLITSKLQQEAANRLKYTAKRTMIIAQQLYEGVELGDEGLVALITYMRTDSTRVSVDAMTQARDYIKTHMGADFLPETHTIYKSKKGAQDAHEAIRPTSLSYPPERIKAFVSVEQFRLYQLIWRNFLASQMVPAVYDQVGIDFVADTLKLRAGGSRLKHAGFLQIYLEAADVHDPDGGAHTDDGQNVDDGALEALPPLIEKQTVDVHEVLPEQHFTQPPPRFNESSLVRELEERGIGRPSTYATILSTIVTRGYVNKDEGRFYPSELGSMITELLLKSFPNVLDIAFTAHMEEQLDAVETGAVDWVKLLRDFYHGGFALDLERAKTDMRDVKREETPTEHKCSLCQSTMVIKWGRNGSFLACTGYPACRNTRDYKRTLHGLIEILPEATTDQLCPICQGAMVVKRGRFGQFYACATYPECKGTRPISIGISCPLTCGSYVAERRSKRGRTFFGCANYPHCNFVSWDRPVMGPCPSCDSAYLVRKYSKKDGVAIKCPNKECGYSRDPELDDADARAVAEA